MAPIRRWPGRLSFPATLQELLYGFREMPTGARKERSARTDHPDAHRVGGLPAMRALAHPTRVRMMHLLRSEALSACGSGARKERSARPDHPDAHRVGGLPAMRALAHPTRVRMMHLLRSEALSAS